MQNFHYKALNKKGDQKDGVVTATSYKEALAKVKERGLYPTEVTQQDDTFNIGGTKRKKGLFSFGVKPKHIVPFVSDLAVLIDSGVPLVRSLVVMQGQSLSPALLEVVESITVDVEGGQPLSESVSRHPKAFNKLFINMIKAGEVGGILSATLARLASLFEKSARLEAKLKAALTYPLIVLLFALTVVVFIVAFIVPKFFVVFSDMGAELPSLTLGLYHTSNYLRDWWYIIAIALFGAVVLLKFLMKNPKFKYVFDSMLIKLPVFGDLFTKIAISRFCRTFGTLLLSGVPILQTISIAKDASGNSVFESAIERVRESVKEGESVAVPLARSGIFPPLVTNMITVGEETGALSQMLVKISDRYDDEVDVMVSQLTSLIEPFLIVGLGVIVGFIVVALFLPLVSIVDSLTGL